MSPSPIVIRPRIERLQRFQSGLLLGMAALLIGSTVALMLHSPPAKPIKPEEWPILLFFVPLLLLGVLGVAVIGARLGLETQKWIVARDYFRCQSQILCFGWSKRIRATAWRVERQNYKGHIYYLLNPVGARVGAALFPFYTTSSALHALNLGRQLALESGWPLRLSGELKRLEKQLEKELQL